MTSEFDRDTAVSEQEPGRYTAEITPRWNVGSVPNGGYVMSIGLRALAASLPGRDPLSVTAHFLRPTSPGRLDLAVESLKQGKTVSTSQASLRQSGREVARLLASFGTLDLSVGPRFVDGEPPALPPLADALPPPAGIVEVGHRFDTRYDPATANRRRAGGPPEHAELRAWQRFADGREPDVIAMPLLADAMPPPAFAVLEPGWVPTIELTVHIRARPVPGWLRCRFRTRFVFAGYLEEDGEIWDASGQLVALSRQLAAVPARGFK